LTRVLERLFSGSDVMKSHGILHEASGRFFKDYSLGRGYTYVFDAPNFFRGNMFFGQISGITF